MYNSDRWRTFAVECQPSRRDCTHQQRRQESEPPVHGREEAPAIVPGPPLGWWACIRREGLPRVYQPGAVPALCGLATGDHGQLEPRSIACVPDRTRTLQPCRCWPGPHRASPRIMPLTQSQCRDKPRLRDSEAREKHLRTLLRLRLLRALPPKPPSGAKQTQRLHTNRTAEYTYMLSDIRIT